MKEEQMLALCVKHDWRGMERIFCVNGKHDYKILASAVIEAYQKDPQNAGLSRWDVWLDAHPNFLKGIVRFNLRDFYQAWHLAEVELKDPVVAKKITDYISAHQKKLYNIFKPGRLTPSESVQLSEKLFVMECKIKFA